jgi:polar amino acid transport system substrate-binding protein
MSQFSLLASHNHRIYTYSFLIGLFLFLSPSYAAPKLKICHEASNYPPYIYQQDNQAQGLLVDIILGAAEALNIQIEFDAKPWNRCQKDVKTGRSHALFAMIKTPKRANEYAFPLDEKNHLWTAKYPIFTSKKARFSLSNYTPDKGLGAPLGYVVWQKLKERGWLTPYQYTPEQGLKMVANGKLDGYVVERLIGLHLLHENQLSDHIIHSEENLLDTIWYLPFNRSFYLNNQNLVTSLWSELGKTRTHLEKQYQKTTLRKGKAD